MLRIERETVTSELHDVLRLDGQIAGPWVGELRAACLEAIRHGVIPLKLDLLGVTFIDAAGLELLRDLWDRLVVTRSSLFAAEQLRTFIEREERTR